MKTLMNRIRGPTVRTATTAKTIVTSLATSLIPMQLNEGCHGIRQSEHVRELICFPFNDTEKRKYCKSLQQRSIGYSNRIHISLKSGNL
ncbi:unnamed protein product [Nesidiocoris tenuis]|uniref:Uncharacterized protein n=1 Tax=Nesidiocoris tenuis TaxID=355587 RepID=A0A6H5HIV6_9HEMI|nr:unnamed protein product [Nesidiocoris tenuis]